MFKYLQVRIIAVVLVGIFLGCVSTENEPYDYGFTLSHLDVQRDKEQLTNIEHVYVGMTRTEVASIMGNSVEIGYKRKNNESPEAIALESPYKKEVIKQPDHRYDVHYYFIDVRVPDGKITEDELMPLIFEGNKLIGKGYSFLSKIEK